ncbi:MAG: hypothetical protein ACTSX4_09595 [Candidatus Helarchaeota archaeon]
MMFHKKNKLKLIILGFLFILSFSFILSSPIINNILNSITNNSELNLKKPSNEQELGKLDYPYPIWRFVSRIVDFAKGTQQTAGNPNSTLGIPTGGGKMAGGTDVFSLGGAGGPVNGFIIYAFDGYETVPVIENGPGADFVIYENGFNLNGQPDSRIGFWEIVTVDVSSDGIIWARYPTWCDPNAPEGSGMSPSNRSHFSGVAGTWPVNVSEAHPEFDPAIQSEGGGDFFDLEDLVSHPAVLNGSVNLMNINFIKVTDIISTNPPENGDMADNGIYWKDPTWGGADMDGAFIINYHIRGIEDNEPPVLITGGENTTIELGTSENNISWTWNDTHSFKYNITLLEDVIDEGSWSSNVPISINVDGLEIGEYIYVCSVNDTYGNSAMDSIKVTVQDMTNPQLDAADSDLQYELGADEQYISWTWSDAAPNQYELYQNTSRFDDGTWNSGTPINISISGLDLGVYEYNCIVNDTSGHSSQHVITITVVDTTSPMLQDIPSDIFYAQGSTGNEINWTWFDLKPGKYNITQNTSLIRYNDWNSSSESIIINVDGLDPGVYFYRCNINDTSGNDNYDEVKVTVTAELTIVGSEDFNYIIGEKNQKIQWIATTTNIPDGYQINNNTTFVEGGTWISGEPIILDVTGLEIGIYEFNCSVKDLTGVSIFDLVTVNVTADTQEPVLMDSSADLEIELGSSDNFLNWTWDDLHPDTYTIKRNGSEINSSNWEAVSPIIEDIDGLQLGLHSFTCEVNDTFGNLNSHLILVNVTDKTSPNLINYSLNSTFELGSTGNSINWTWYDLSPDKYEIKNNENLIESGNWTEYLPIISSVDGLEVGVYNFTCEVNDTSGNSHQKLIEITISDSIAPKFENINISFLERTVYGTQHDYQFNCTWLDFSNITVYFNLNGTFYEVQENVNGEYFTTFSGLEPGSYTYYWMAHDEYFNMNDSMEVKSFEIILDTFPPTYAPPQLENNASVIEEGVPMNISIIIYDGELTSGIQTVIIYYSTNLQDWNFSLMVLNSTTVINESTGEIESLYIGLIPGQFKISRIYYYIEIVDNQGNVAKTITFEIRINYVAPTPLKYDHIILLILLITVVAVTTATIMRYVVKKRKKPSESNKKSKFYKSNRLKKISKLKENFVLELTEILTKNKGSTYFKRIDDMFPKKKQFIFHFFYGSNVK